jgi:hypothetical protein
MTAAIIITSFALLIAIAAYRSVQNWERQMRDEIRHLELRIDNLMESIRVISKELNK